jgi:hypothetical protein
VLVISLLANVVLVIYCAQLINQRHELDQELAKYHWQDMNKLKEK